MLCSYSLQERVQLCICVALEDGPSLRLLNTSTSRRPRPRPPSIVPCHDSVPHSEKSANNVFQVVNPRSSRKVWGNGSVIPDVPQTSPLYDSRWSDKQSGHSQA